MLEIATSSQGTAWVATLKGRIDATSARELERESLAWIEAGQHYLVFDFSGVEYISSAGLRVFLLVAKRMGAVQGELRLCGMHAIIKDVFDISGFSKLFTIVPSVAEAV